MTCWILNVQDVLDVQDVLARVLVVVIHLAILHVAIAPQVPRVLPVVVLVVVDVALLVLVHPNHHLVRDVHQVVQVDVIQDVHLHVVELQNLVLVLVVVPDVLALVVLDAVESVQKHVQAIANMAA